MLDITRNIKPEHVDSRGGITKILDITKMPIRSVLYITSKKGTVRSNHYHKKDTHYCHLLTGKAEYFEKPVEGGKLESSVLNAGDMVFTDSMLIHAFKFLEDTEMMAYATQSRAQADYESDTVRVDLIPAPKVIAQP